MTYNELKTELETAPTTWLPALLVTLVKEAYLRGGVFVPGGAANLATKAEADAMSEKTGVNSK